MRIIIVIILSAIYSQKILSVNPASLEIDFISNQITTNDTAGVNSYVRKALAYVPLLSRDVNSQSPRVDKIKSNIDSAELVCRMKKMEFPSLLYVARAEYFFLKNDFTGASHEAGVALKKAKKNGENYVIARVLNFMGRFYYRTHFYSESLEYFIKSIDVAEKEHLKGLIPRNYNGLADVYYMLYNPPEYRKNLRMVIKTAEIENDSLHLEDGLFRLGSILTDVDRDFRVADSLLNKCLEISTRIKDTTYISLSLANLGWNLSREKKYDQAIEYYNKSLIFSINGKRHSSAANSYGNLGTIYRDLKDSKKSLMYYGYSVEQAKLVNDIFNLNWVYQDMSEMYIRMKDTANAYKSYVLFKKYSDEQMMKFTNQGLTDAKIRNEIDSNSKEVELLSLRLGNQRLLIYGYTGLFILSIAIGILFYSRSRINAKRRLSDMNRKISEITQANLRQQMNPHFIFNTLNSIQYYMYQHDKLSTNNYLTKFSSLMRKILENSQHTAIPLRDELDALTLYLELEMIRFKDKFDYSIKVDDEIDTILYKVPTMLIQPYVENSICHGLMPSEGKGLVKIDLKLEKEYISCTIEDNGIGRDASHDKKKKTTNNHTSLGTQIVSSRLDLVNTLYGTSLKTTYTDLKTINGEPGGTRVEIQIPIMS